MDRKIIFLDIDGTLTEPGSNEPPNSAVKAIKAAQKKGHYVFLCTGRNFEMLSPLLKYGFDGVVASSGGYIKVGDEVVYDCPMTDAQREKTMRILKENGIFRTVECLEGSYTDEGFKAFLKENAGIGGNSELLRWREQLEKSLNILPMETYSGQPIYKIVIMCRFLEQLKIPMQALADEFEFCIQDADKYGIINGEVLNKKFDKGQGIVRVCTYLDIPLEDTMAFGDSMNDKEMMETAGFSICMANGNDRIKQMADDICPSVKDGGIFHAFRKYHLV